MTDTNTEKTATLDPVAAEKCAATADVAELAGQVALYERAAAVVQNKLLLIQRDELQPIASELSGLRSRLERAETRVAIAEFVEAGPNEMARSMLLRNAETVALQAYRRAEQTPGAPRETIVQAWNSVVFPYSSSKRAIGLPRQDGSILTQLEHQATFYRAFVSITARMAALSTDLSLDERLKLSQNDAMRAQFVG